MPRRWQRDESPYPSARFSDTNPVYEGPQRRCAGGPQRPSGSAGLNGTGRRSQRLDPVEDRVGNLLLGGERDVMLRPPLDDQHFVLRALEADLRARDIVEDDRVGALPLDFSRARSMPSLVSAAKPTIV